MSILEKVEVCDISLFSALKLLRFSVSRLAISVPPFFRYAEVTSRLALLLRPRIHPSITQGTS